MAAAASGALLPTIPALTHTPSRVSRVVALRCVSIARPHFRVARRRCCRSQRSRLALLKALEKRKKDKDAKKKKKRKKKRKEEKKRKEKRVDSDSVEDSEDDDSCDASDEASEDGDSNSPSVPVDSAAPPHQELRELQVNGGMSSIGSRSHLGKPSASKRPAKLAARKAIIASVTQVQEASDAHDESNDEAIAEEAATRKKQTIKCPTCRKISAKSQKSLIPYGCKATSECPVCMNDLDRSNAVVLPCGHLICKDCTARIEAEEAAAAAAAAAVVATEEEAAAVAAAVAAVAVAPMPVVTSSDEEDEWMTSSDEEDEWMPSSDRDSDLSDSDY